LLQTIRPDSKVELSPLGKLFNSVDKEVEMGRAYPLKAPLDVNVGEGESWDEAAH
jgi:DNA polymerase I-like protein with 3'-5' exonuclease and polymerase domains